MSLPVDDLRKYLAGTLPVQSRQIGGMHAASFCLGRETTNRRHDATKSLRYPSVVHLQSEFSFRTESLTRAPCAASPISPLATRPDGLCSKRKWRPVRGSPDAANWPWRLGSAGFANPTTSRVRFVRFYDGIFKTPKLNAQIVFCRLG